MYDTQEFNDLYDYLLDTETASEQTLGVALALGGQTVETLESVLFVLTGYRTLEQLTELE